MDTQFEQLRDARRAQPIVEMQVPELSITIHVRRMKVMEIRGLLKMDGVEGGMEAVARSLVRPDGTRIFVDRAAVADLDFDVYAPISAAVQLVNGLGKQIEAAARKPDPTTTGAAGTAPVTPEALPLPANTPSSV